MRPKYALAEEYRFTDPTPYDGLTIEEMFEDVLGSCGYDSAEY
jgi:hypothetical protein